MTSNGKIPTHTDRVRELAKYIAAQPDDEPEEITAEHIIEAMKAGAVIATGSHAAMSKQRAEEITVTDHAVPEPKSGIHGIITAGGGFVLGLVKAVNNFYAFGTLVVLLAAFIAWLKLRP
jgi:hypothetical protein